MECFQNLSLQIPVRLMALGLSEKGMSKPISILMHHQAMHFFLVLHYKVLLCNAYRASDAKYGYKLILAKPKLVDHFRNTMH